VKTNRFTHAAWWKNLRSSAPVTLRLRGREVQGLAEPVAEDKQAIAAGLVAHVRKVPSDARFYGVTFDDASFEEIDAYIERQMDRLNIPGVSLAIVEGDQIVHLRGFGRARPGGEAPTPQTPFFIGSTTKSFTALAVVQLVEAGKVELDAPVQRYLPWFRVADPQASAQMTVRHLLNQNSGLPLGSGWQLLADFDDRPDVTERQARALATCKLARSVRPSSTAM
jgi:CubicO group peptidase (beta-lactamase class C family)